MNKEYIAKTIEEKFGVLINRDIEFDGTTFHRFDLDKKGDKAVWVIAFPDGNAMAGNWKTGEVAFIPSNSEAVVDRQTKESLIKKTQEMIEKMQKEAIEEARALYESLPPASEDQEYLVRKHIKAVDGVRQEGRSLVIPGYGSDGNLQTIQHILPNNEKRFFYGCKTSGSYFVIGKITKRMYLVEGYATGYSVYEATGDGVVVAFNAGNLKDAASSFLSAHPEVQLIVVADNDNPSNGATKGIGEIKAAKTGLPYILVPFVGMDANDYAIAGNDLKSLLETTDISSSNPLGLVYDYAMDNDMADLGWLIEDWIPRSSITMIYGAPGCGKSTLSLDMFFSYCCKLAEWNGYEIDNQGGIGVYLCGEGYFGMTKRKKAWEQVHNIKSIERCVFSKKVLKLNTPEGLEETIKALKQIGKPIDMIVIDTFRKAYAGDENDAGETEEFFGALQKLSEEFQGASIVVVHHTGKNPKGGPRGSSNHAASVDVLISVERDRVNNIIKVTQEKQKDSEELEPANFKLMNTTLVGVRNKKGKEMKASYIVPATDEDDITSIYAKNRASKNDGLSIFGNMWKGTSRALDGEPEELPFVSIADFLDYYVAQKGLKKKSAANYLRPERCPFSDLLTEGSMQWEEEGFYLKNKDLIETLIEKKQEPSKKNNGTDDETE